MKSILLSIAILFSVSVFAQKDTTKHITITGNLQQMQGLLEVINLSTAPHTTVEAIKGWLIAQINKQLADKEQPKK